MAATASGLPLKSAPMWGMTIQPQRAMARPAPMEWDMFQIDILVASSSGLIHWVRVLVQGGTPMP